MEEVFSPSLVMRGLALRIELLLSSRTVYKAPPIASQTPALVPPLPRLDPRSFNVRRNEAGEYFVKGSVVNAMRKNMFFMNIILLLLFLMQFIPSCLSMAIPNVDRLISWIDGFINFLGHMQFSIKHVSFCGI